MRPSLAAALVVALCLLNFAAQAQSTNAARSIEELRGQLEAHLTQPRFNGAAWGVKIASLDSGQTVYERHGDRLLSPASNSKLYAGALALDHFGGDYRIRTPILATAKPSRKGKLRGDVIVVGQGDPSWRPDPTNFWAVFEPFVNVLTEAGVRRVTGDIIADATFFRGPPSGASWTVDDMEDYYGAEISAITLADNCAELRVTSGDQPDQPCALEWLQPLAGLTLDNRTMTTTNGGPIQIAARRVIGESTLTVLGELPAGGTNEIVDVPVPRPANWFAAALKEALVRHGIRVDGEARGVRWPAPSPIQADCVSLGEVVSPPLRELVSVFMKRSQNLETDLIFNHVGETTRSAATPAWRTSEQLGVDALEAFLQTNGLPANDLHFDEGSGLSRNNLTSANLTVELLKLMASHAASNDFLNALPVAGVDGTLRRRMKGTPAEGNVRAKTGTLRWANSLSGYVTSEAGERFVFSLMLNRNVSPPGRNGRAELDDIAIMLAGFANRSDTTLESLCAPQGRLLLTPLVNAPFPHPARAEGHVYRDQLFSAPDHYSDGTVALFIPRGFRETAAVDFVLYFHGWGNSVVGSLEQQRLIEQFVASGKNAVLVVPAGPRNASDSFGGKLEDPEGFKRFLEEVIATLHSEDMLTNQQASVGDVILSGHSGGYRVLSAILDRGGLPTAVKEVWLFDALYGGTETFVEWQTRQDGRMLILYTDGGGTTNETHRAMELLVGRGIPYEEAEEGTAVELGPNSSSSPREERVGKGLRRGETPSNKPPLLHSHGGEGEDTDMRSLNSTAVEGQAAPETLPPRGIVFLHTDLRHAEVVAKRDHFAQFLESSCLEDQ